MAPCSSTSLLLGACLAPLGPDLGLAVFAGTDMAAGEAASVDSPIAILTAEIALLHARLDDLQLRMGR